MAAGWLALPVGSRADWIVLDTMHVSLNGQDPWTWLSGIVCCEHGGTPVRDVYVGGAASCKLDDIATNFHYTRPTALPARNFEC